MIPEEMQPHADALDHGTVTFVGPCLGERAGQGTWERPSGAEKVLLVSLGATYTNLPGSYRSCIQAFAAEPRPHTRGGASRDRGSWEAPRVRCPPHPLSTGRHLAIDGGYTPDVATWAGAGTEPEGLSVSSASSTSDRRSRWPEIHGRASGSVADSAA